MDEGLRYQRGTIGGFYKLPKTYKQSKGGYTFNQVDRNDKAAIYKASGDDVWEVFKVKKAKGFDAPKGKIPDREEVPTSNDFGVWAWSYGDEKSAIRKFEKLSK